MLTNKQIADLSGKTSTIVSRTLKKYNLTPWNSILQDIQDEKIGNLYSQGMGVTDIGKQLKVSHAHVIYRLKLKGIYQSNDHTK